MKTVMVELLLCVLFCCGSVLSSEPTDHHSHCLLPMKVGSCRASFTKYFYNVTSGSCMKFIYGGCENNSNNFDSQEECEKSCIGVTGSVLPAKVPRMALVGPTDSDPAATKFTPPQKTGISAEEYAELCEVEPKVGPCRAALKHWHYNKTSGHCQTFIYGGCRGNKNNYITEESCMTTCSVSILPSSKKVSVEVKVSADYKDYCMVSPDTGPCRAAFPMYYYDPNTATCQSFMYGGCKGNKNRYGTIEECMSRCSGEGGFDTRGRTRNRWTAAFFLFVTVAAISALLLATLVIITLRRHRLSRRSPTISDKEELLPDEQSSVDSLTIPESPTPEQKA